MKLPIILFLISPLFNQVLLAQEEGDLTKVTKVDQAFLPFKSVILAEKVQYLTDLEKTCQKSIRPSYSSKSQYQLVKNQFLANAQYLLLKKAVMSLKNSTLPLELNQEVFQHRLFQLSNQYCRSTIVDKMTLGDFIRTWWSDSQVKSVSPELLTDQWIQSALSLKEQNKHYILTSVRLLDSIRDLCSWNPLIEIPSLLHVYLSDRVLGDYVLKELKNSNSQRKIFLEEKTYNRRTMNSTDWMGMLPTALTNSQQEGHLLEENLQAIWCQDFYFSDFLKNADITRAVLNPSRDFSKLTVKLNRQFLRDQILEVHDYFYLAGVSKNPSAVFFNQLKEQIDLIAKEQFTLFSQRVPFGPLEEVDVLSKEITKDNPLILQLIVTNGQLDKVYATADKWTVVDDLHWSRNYWEWLIRETEQVPFLDPMHFQRSLEKVRNHLNLKLKIYLSSRQEVMKHITKLPDLSLKMVDALLEQRNAISQFLKDNPTMSEIPFEIHHLLGHQALKASLATLANPR